jgi:hypothetical protein
MVKITLVFDFMPRGVGDKNGKGVSLWVYESGFIIGDSCGPEVGEPIVCIFLAISVNELRCDTRD